MATFRRIWILNFNGIGNNNNNWNPPPYHQKTGFVITSLKTFFLKSSICLMPHHNKSLNESSGFRNNAVSSPSTGAQCQTIERWARAVSAIWIIQWVVKQQQNRYQLFVISVLSTVLAPKANALVQSLRKLPIIHDEVYAQQTCLYDYYGSENTLVLP